MARQSARAAHQQIRNGVDPRDAKRAARDALRAANAKQMTFDEAAAKHYKMKAPGFRSAKHAENGAYWESSQPGIQQCRALQPRSYRFANRRKWESYRRGVDPTPSCGSREYLAESEIDKLMKAG